MCVSPSGFNPVWEETLSFTLHMAEVALVRFLVWDHDPIGRDFIGQRTVAFSSLMPGLFAEFICDFILVCFGKKSYFSCIMNDMNFRGDTVCHYQLKSRRCCCLTQIDTHS